MRTVSVESCCDAIGGYLTAEATGHVLVVDAEDYASYAAIRTRLADGFGVECVYLSSLSKRGNMPDVVEGLSKVSGEGSFALIGVSDALMMRGAETLKASMRKLVDYSVNGHAVILLHHAREYLLRLSESDPRLEEKKCIVLAEGKPSPLPEIKFLSDARYATEGNVLNGMGELLSYLEQMTPEKFAERSLVTVLTKFDAALFSGAVYSVSAGAGFYEIIMKHYADLSSSAVPESYGSESNWEWLLRKLKGCKTFSELVVKEIGEPSAIFAALPRVMRTRDDDEKWLCWLSLKVFGVKGDKYMGLVLANSVTSADFLRHVYLDLADVPHDDANFSSYYDSRKYLIGEMELNLPLTSEYIQAVGKWEKDAIFYLTDMSDGERYEFCRLMSIYDYDDKTFGDVIKKFSSLLSAYMQKFDFNQSNMQIAASDEELYGAFTDYFEAYRKQKIINRIDKEKFLPEVEKFSLSRPYNKVPSRSSIIRQIDRKGADVYFFDALGVEYLPFIMARCEHYGLFCEVSVGRAELPSITSQNKEFLQYFEPKNQKNIKQLDEIKHHSQDYNYEKCQLPIHIFAELKAIDDNLKNIASSLEREPAKRIVIASDHGASRLAVLYGKEAEAAIELSERGKHSGRCCPSEADPNIAYAAHENGYSVIANYERFRGGRKADVEVHGGASLEEVLVPVIIVTRKPAKLKVEFTPSVIELKINESASLNLYVTMTLKAPLILVNGKFYRGEYKKDNNHLRFALRDIKKKGKYTADVYDGHKKIASDMAFEIRKAAAKEVDLF